MKLRFSLVLVVTSFVASLASASSLPSKSVGYDGQRLIKLSEFGSGQWLDEDRILDLRAGNVTFMDITGRKFPKKKAINSLQKLDLTGVKFSNQVKSIISNLGTTRAEQFLTHFTSYENRNYTLATGLESALFLLSQVQSSIDESGYGGTVTAAQYPHSWLQPSIIATIQGSDDLLKDEIVILGAHLDSKNRDHTLPSPGADDNGSGCAVLLETFRLLLESDFIPKRTIEFQWYAAEEDGLKGSGDIAEAYSFAGTNVVSMINFDVPGYFVEGRREIGIHTNYVDPQLSDFLRLLVENYAEFTWTNMSFCTSPCSDHASFNEYYFSTAFPASIVYNENMHTEYDTVANVSFIQIQEFTKVAIAYAIELSESSGQEHPIVSYTLLITSLLFIFKAKS